MKLVSIKLNSGNAATATLVSEDIAQSLANQLYAKGVFADQVSADFDNYDTQIQYLTTHLNDMRKLVGVANGITL